MPAYIARRVLLMIPTLFGIMLLSFITVQFAPGGRSSASSRSCRASTSARRRASRAGPATSPPAPGAAAIRPGRDVVALPRRAGLDPQFIRQLEQQFGFDKPAHERFAKMIWDYARFDFGKSYFRDVSVLQPIREKLPVSITLGLWMTLLSYAISIPLGIRKAVRDGSAFDIWTSAVVIVGYAIPGFLFAILFIALRRRLVLAALPAARLVVGQLERALAVGEDRRLPLAHRPADRGDGDRRLRDLDALDQELVPRRDPQAIRPHRAHEGPLERRVLYGHVFRNAMLIVVGLSRRLHPCLLRRVAADRNDLLARRARPSVLQTDRQPRLSGGVREPLHLLASGSW